MGLIGLMGAMGLARAPAGGGALWPVTRLRVCVRTLAVPVGLAGTRLSPAFRRGREHDIGP